MGGSRWNELGFPVQLADEHDRAYGDSEKNECGEGEAGTTASAPAAGNGADGRQQADERRDEDYERQRDGSEYFHRGIRSLLPARRASTAASGRWSRK